MSILKATESTPIAIGQFVHAKSKLPYGLYDTGRMVTGFGGTQRILYEKEGKETFMLRNSVLLICDTKEEADCVLQHSLDRNSDIQARIDRVLEDVGHHYDASLEVLIASRQKAVTP